MRQALFRWPEAWLVPDVAVAVSTKPEVLPPDGVGLSLMQWSNHVIHTAASPTLELSNCRKQITNMVSCGDTLLTTNQSIPTNNPTRAFSPMFGFGIILNTLIPQDIDIAVNSFSTR